MAEKQKKNPLVGGLKVLLILALGAPAAMWIDEKFGPGYLAGVQQKIVPAKTGETDETTDKRAKPDETPAKTGDTPDAIGKDQSETAKASVDADNNPAQTTPAPEKDQKQSDAQKVPADSDTATAQAKAAAQQPAVEIRLKGIDISHYQGVIDWQVLAKDKLDFVFVKATGGETYTDPQFNTNWHALRGMKVARGAYHFFYAADDGKAQAENFLKTVGNLKPTDLPPVLDVEITDHVEAKALVEGVLTWLETIEDETDRLPIIYTDVSFGKQYLSDPRLAKYPLWIADYGKAVEGVPTPWQDSGWSFWQYSQTGHVLGIKGMVDLDVFNGDDDKFKAFIQSTISK